MIFSGFCKIIRLINSKIPFGGVGNSGMGNYHGKCSFDIFSHKKSIVKTGTFFDPPLRYAPYKKGNLNIFKCFLNRFNPHFCLFDNP